MKSTVWGICVAVAVMAAVAPVHAGETIYTGELSVGDGLVADGGWNQAETTLSWVVSHVDGSSTWHYEYTLTVAEATGAGISHIIVEASDGDPGPAFTVDNLFSATAEQDGWLGEIEIGDYDEDNGNPGMEGSVYGIKFNASDDADALTITVSFDSDRIPVWGDFYAKGGEGNMLYNEGFDEADPTDAAGNGSIAYHILVPDTVSVHAPAPGAVLLGGLGTGLVGWLRRRRMV